MRADAAGRYATLWHGLDKRTVLAIALAAITALASSWHGFVLANREARFPLVLAVAPNEPEALARAAALEAARGEQDPAALPAVRDHARNSLRGMALNALPLRLLAISVGQEIAGHVDKTLVELASDVSRRDSGTQALRIRIAAEKGDLPTVLAAYDVILRNGSGSEDEFFAPMSEAVTVPQMVPHFARYVRERAPWVPAFLIYAIPRTDSPRAFVPLLEYAQGLRAYPEGPQIEVMLINRLLQAGHWKDAADFYSSTPAYKPSVLTSAAISRESLVPSENGLLWSLYRHDGPIAEAVADRALVLYANPGEGGEVARKLLFLAPGDYRVDAALEDLDLPDGAAVTLTGRCLYKAGSRTIGSATTKGDSRSRLSFALPVGASCPVQDLAVSIAANEARRTASATIARVALMRTGTSGNGQ